jgi:hypothetical protein
MIVAPYRVLVIIPGPKGPSNLEPYVRELYEDLNRLAYEGCKPSEKMMRAAAKHGVILSDNVRFLIGALDMDTIAGNKLFGVRGCTSYFACPRCALEGSYPDGATSVRSMGYDVQAARPKAGGDALLAAQVARYVDPPNGANVAEYIAAVRVAFGNDLEAPLTTLEDVRGQESCSYGSKPELALIKRSLPYLDVVLSWRIPLMHKFLNGIVRDFMNLLLPDLRGGRSLHKYAVPRGGRKTMTLRAPHCVAPYESGRKYRDINNAGYSGCLSGWTMADIARFLETWSPYILHGVLHEDMKLPFELIRDTWIAIIHHPRREEAEGALPGTYLKQYAIHMERLALQEGGAPEDRNAVMSLLKLNLHVLACHMDEQARWSGALVYATELWIERSMQDLKRTTKYKVTHDGEARVASDIQMSELLRNNEEIIQAKALEREQHIRRGRSLSRCSAVVDDTTLPISFHGRGKIPSIDIHVDLDLAPLLRLSSGMYEWIPGGEDRWGDEDYIRQLFVQGELRIMSAYEFDKAYLEGEFINSLAYKRSNRPGYYAKYLADETTGQYGFCVVTGFYRLELKVRSTNEVIVLRIARVHDLVKKPTTPPYGVLAILKLAQGDGSTCGFKRNMNDHGMIDIGFQSLTKVVITNDGYCLPFTSLTHL